MANTKYFKIKTTDLTDDIVAASVSNNGYELKRNEAGDVVLMEFEIDSIPVELFRLGYSPIEKNILIQEVSDGLWSEGHPISIKSFKDPIGNPVFAPTFEDAQGLTTVWKGHLYTAQPNSLNIFDEVVTTQLKLRGGWYKILDSSANIGDYIEFSIVDKDDILGLFGLFGLTINEDVLELKKFVRTEYISPEDKSRQDFQSLGASEVMAGLYFRTYYYNSGSVSVNFSVSEKYHEA